MRQERLFLVIADLLHFQRQYTLQADLQALLGDYKANPLQQCEFPEPCMLSSHTTVHRLAARRSEGLGVKEHQWKGITFTDDNLLVNIHSSLSWLCHTHKATSLRFHLKCRDTDMSHQA
jgi:hypothetical protein